MKRVLGWLAISLAAAAVLTASVGFYFVRRSATPTSGALELDGIERPVRIVRDIHGIPHIFAESRTDLAFALGYAEAQDRLWQLDLNRHFASGTLASVVGAEAVDTDFFVRTVGFDRSSRLAVEALGPEARAELEAFARGVNAFVAAHPGRQPVEFFLTRHDFERFTSTDCIGSGILMAWGLALNFNDEVLAARLAGKIDRTLLDELFPQPPETILPWEAGASTGASSPSAPRTGARAFPSIDAESAASLARMASALRGAPLGPSELFAGIAASNNWVVSGRRSAGGKPLLANDPHLGLSMPSVWYEVHLVAPDLDCIGAAVTGLPYVVLGHNRRIAFGFTNVMADTEDLYVEKVDPANPRRVWFVDHWEEMARETVSIPVRGGLAVEREIARTRHGPVITPLRPGLRETLALSWVAHRPGRGFEGFRQLDGARNWEEARAAVRLFSDTSLNLVYADVDGNVGWQATGAIPIRARGDGRFPAPGWTGEYEWRGMVPFEELPSCYLPAGPVAPVVSGSPGAAAAGAIATANQRSVRSGYPYVISNSWAPPYRFQRIAALVGERETMTLDDFARIQSDRHAALAAAVLALLDEARLDSEPEREAVEKLRRWDRQVTLESEEAALYELFLVHLARETYGDELGELYADYGARFGAFWSGMDALLGEPGARWWDDVRTPALETRAEIVRRSLGGALSDARERMGSDARRWSWGALHMARFDHFLGRRWPLALALNRARSFGGDGNTINNGAYSVTRPFQIRWGSSYRLLVDLADLGHARAVNTTGQSGRPFSRHYGDMLDDWVAMRYHTLWTDQAEIAANAEGTLRLVPR